MTLSAGARLGAYEIVSLIGAGGMGEVYKARDTRLDRMVALKVLPAALSANPERKVRFEREARAVSALNHPHICALFDIGQQDGVDFLVMEHLEGESLEERLRKGPLPLRETLQHAIQIADALNQAHRQGVIHRDLKPANIMLTRNGAKLLDFGLAKILETSAAATATSLPTVAATLTTQGTIMGTWQYMAPEQLEGAEADARSDIFAFGAVMYEMVTGRKAFQGKSQASLISSIMSGEPQPLSSIQPVTPPAFEHVVRTCLAKDPETRWQTAQDVLVQLRWIAEGGGDTGQAKAETARTGYRERLAWIAAAVLLLFGAAVSWMHFREKAPAFARVRFTIAQPEKTEVSWRSKPTMSPDGRKLVIGTYTTFGGALWLRDLDSLEMRRVFDGYGYFPFWSPDSRSIAFFRQGKLSKMDISGGPPVVICDYQRNGGGGSWNRDGTIIFADSAGGLHRVSAAGGEPKGILRGNVLWPQFLPDGRHFLYFLRTSEAASTGVYLSALNSDRKELVMRGETPAAYAPPGYLLFTRQQTLFAQAFDAGKLRLTGEPFPVAEKVGEMGVIPGAHFSASENGVLAYRQGNAPESQLCWYSRDGKRLGTAGASGRFRQMSLSPDSRQAIIERADPKDNTFDLWTMNLESGILSRVTFNPADETDAVWSPDSREIIFSSNRNGQLDLFRKVIGGGEEQPLLVDKDRKVCEWWLKDGSVIYTDLHGNTIYRLPLAGERKPEKLLHTEFLKDEPHVSPDGKWVAYGSMESGQWEVYVAAFPSFNQKRQVSDQGGGQALWRGDGKELFYLGLDGKVMAVDVKTGASIEAGLPRLLFETRLRPSPLLDQYGVTPDGKKFLFVEPAQEEAKPIMLVLNWFAR